MKLYWMMGLLVAAGCARSTPSERQSSGSPGTGAEPGAKALEATAPSPPSPPSPPSSATAAASDAAPACDGEPRAHLARARAEAKRAFRAMDSAGAMRVAKAEWAAVSAPCRDGRWYYVAAVMLSFASGPLEAGAELIASESAALASGLEHTDDVELFARIAYSSARGRGPTLPSDGCARAQALEATSHDRDAVVYTCAHAAITAGDGPAAARLLAEIKEPRRWLDTELVQAQAARLAHDKDAIRRFARAAAKVDEERANMANVPVRDVKLVTREAGRLLSLAGE